MKQKITESQLRDSVRGLREYMAIVEGEQQVDELSAAEVGQGIGQAAGGVAGLAAAPVRAAGAAGSWLADKAGQAWDAAKQGASNFAQGAAQGAQQGWAATDPTKLAQAAGNAISQATKPAKYPTTPQEIKAFQQANGLTPDGIAGPKTQAALAKAGLKPAAAPAKPAAPAGAQSTKPAAPAKPGAAPLTQTQQNMAAAGMAGQEMRSPEEIAASQDLLTANDGSTTSGAAAQARNPNAGLTPDDPRWQGPKPAAAPAPAAPAPTATAESVTFKNDELSRLVSLVQYR